MAEPKYRKMRIGPFKARALLDHGVANRAISKKTVERYARDMKSGRWGFCPVPITLADGKLADGQHRLLAVIESGVTIPVTICECGWNDGAMLNLDTGRRRTYADVLRIRGEQNYNVLAAGLRLLALHSAGHPPIQAGCGYVLSNHELDATLEQHPKMRESAGCYPHGLIRMIPSGVYAFFRYVFSNIDREAADSFFEGIIEGAGLRKDDSVFLLRRILLPREPMAAAKRAALIIKAWNLRYRDMPCKLLRWIQFGPQAEDFPDIEGCPIKYSEPRQAGFSS